MRKESLALLEQQSQAGEFELFYGDESRISTEGYVPYGWQFPDEQVSIKAEPGRGLNCFALIARNNKLLYATCQENITADFIIGQLDAFSLTLTKPTMVVLDNARVHTAAKVKERVTYWQERGLYLFHLPPYSPHLNLAERLWKELKSRWIRAEDYLTTDTLFYAVSLALAAVGKELIIHFNEFKV